MKIAIFGTGGIGGYFGGRLAAAGHDVRFLARGRNLEALRRDGLTIHGPHGEIRIAEVAATDAPEEIGPVDVVLFTVKLYDADGAAARLAPLIGADTVVITLQNGVEVVDIVSRHVGPQHVAGGAAYIVAALEAPGRIRHTTHHRLVFGERDGSISPRLSAFAAAGQGAGFEAVVSPAIELDLWTKFVRLATWSGVSALARSPMGVLRDDPELTGIVAAALDEAIAVGRARGVPIPPSIVEETARLVTTFPYESKSSMLEDLENGRRLELPWLSGAVVRMGRQCSVPTPVHTVITAALGPFAAGTRNAESARASR